MTSADGGIEVVSGNPDDSELAAVLCVLLAARGGQSQSGGALGEAVSATPAGGAGPLPQRLLWRIVHAASHPSASAGSASGTAVRRRRRRLRTVELEHSTSR
ncbi:acyl-CoA carboxylase subunit epsilon [Jatrophihabitans sp.]|jgi:hypothetical protein|uniref:acyl-CoA carboxylase subunit epsilon n=1 Tax=Jatrophihabitans sp. TaxID=1932789 RepID=UPI0038CD3C4E